MYIHLHGASISLQNNIFSVFGHQTLINSGSNSQKHVLVRSPWRHGMVEIGPPTSVFKMMPLKDIVQNSNDHKFLLPVWVICAHTSTSLEGSIINTENIHVVAAVLGTTRLAIFF